MTASTVDADPTGARRRARRRRRAWSVRIRPTVVGALLVVGLISFLVVGPQVTDPAVAGMVWAAAFALLIIGVVWPCATVMSVSVNVADPLHRASGVNCPARVGEVATVSVRVGARLGEVAVTALGESAEVRAAAGPPLVVEVPMSLRRRGWFTALGLVVRSDAPFGVVVATREVVLQLPRPVVVGPPRRRVAPVADVPSGSPGVRSAVAVGHGGDTTRSVRPYVTGDPAHLVHWPTTARIGSIVVRELEPPQDASVAVVVDVGPNGTDDVADPLPMPTTSPPVAARQREEMIAVAAATVEDLVARGVRVMLCTATDDGPVAAEVVDEAGVLRRLAAAGAGTPAPAPAGWPVLHLREPDGHG